MSAASAPLLLAVVTVLYCIADSNAKVRPTCIGQRLSYVRLTRALDQGSLGQEAGHSLFFGVCLKVKPQLQTSV